MSWVIDVQGINKRFGDKHVVQDLALQVRPGEIFGFLGPNGSGKTTSIRMLCGLLTPDSGSGTCLGFDVLTESAAIKRQVGYMTQKFSLWDDLTIAENLEFVARMFGMKNRRAVVDEALENLGLSGRRNQLAGTLSGGWKQRLALASCLLHNPRLLLLDEPTAGVDPAARRDFWEEIHRLSARGITVLVSTHYMDEAERCHRLAYIAYGKLLASGATQAFIDAPHLVTWRVEGAHAHSLVETLRSAPGIEQVATFGTALHVSARESSALSLALERYASDPALVIRPVKSSLEDVFIHLMRSASDQFPDQRT